MTLLANNAAGDDKFPAADLTGDDLVQLARVDFGAFVVLLFPELHPGKSIVPAPYIDLIATILMRSTDGGWRKLIFNLPPGYMKSLLISILYTAWRLGVNPSEKIICISYGDDLSHDLSVKTRLVMQSKLYRRIFPGTVLDKKAEDKITTTKGGQRYATAVSSDIAGFRADLIIIDDPMQPNEAASELAKQKLRDFYYGVVAQRLRDQNTGVIILVMHRLAPDDLTATFLEEGEWKRLALPLVATKEVHCCDGRAGDETILHRMPGDLLSPNWQGADAVGNLKKTLPSHVFESQYQQNPLYGGSGMCSIDRIARYDNPPPFELTIHSGDIAGTKDGGNFTVCLKFGLAKDHDKRDVLYLTQIIRMRVELPDVRAAIEEQDRLDKPALIVLDGNGIGLGILQDLKRRMQNLLPATSSMEGSELGGKKQQFFNMAVQDLYDGLIRVPNNMQNLDVFLQEIAAFPNCKNNDQVDALSNIAASRNTVLHEARRRADRFGRWHKSQVVVEAARAPTRRTYVRWERGEDRDD